MSPPVEPPRNFSRFSTSATEAGGLPAGLHAAGLAAEFFPEAALERSMTGFAQHYDAAVERALASDARANAVEASNRELMASNRGLMASNRGLMADLAAARFGAETKERLKSALDGIVDPEEFQKATAHVTASRTAEELFAFFDRRH